MLDCHMGNVAGTPRNSDLGTRGIAGDRRPVGAASEKPAVLDRKPHADLATGASDKSINLALEHFKSHSLVSFYRLICGIPGMAEKPHRPPGLGGFVLIFKDSSGW